MEPVSHFGLHDAGGVWFLEQEGAGKPALPVRVPSPFRVSTKAICPHRIPVPARPPEEVQAIWKVGWAQHPLVAALSPVPTDDKVFFIRNTDLSLVSELARLCSPTRPIVLPIWSQQLRTLAKELQVTNVAPLILTGLAIDHLSDLRKLVQAALVSPRRLVLAGGDSAVPPPGVHIISAQPGGDPSQLPLEEIGGWLLTEWMTDAAT